MKIEKFKMTKKGLEVGDKKPDYKKYLDLKRANDSVSQYKKSDASIGNLTKNLESYISKFRKEHKPVAADREFNAEGEISDPKFLMQGKKQYLKKDGAKWVHGSIDDEGNFRAEKDGTWKSHTLKITAKGNTIKEAHDSFKAQAKTKIQEARKKIKELNEEMVSRDSHMIPVLNESVNKERIMGVYVEPNTFLKILRKKSIGDVFKQKVPKDKDLHIGLELEFYGKIKKSDLGLALFEAGLKDHVYIRTDGSIRPDPGEEGHELNVIMKQGEMRDVVKKVSDVLKKLGAKVNKSCGMHVHFDMRTRDHKLAFNNLVAAQQVLYSMLPANRRQNTEYAKRNKSRDFDTHVTDGDRYLGINPQAFRKFNTLEARMHSGTVEYEKIAHWIDLLITIINKKEKLDYEPRSLTTFKDEFNVSDELMQYVETRINKFKGRDNKEEEAA